MECQYEALYRLRIGAYRVILKKDEARLIILVVRIGHRKEIYPSRADYFVLFLAAALKYFKSLPELMKCSIKPLNVIGCWLEKEIDISG
ncbi:MAG: type II toxin-antitoxin system RelE/ParE family toxin [Clostridiales bacterium]|nr:type II toxin-antitoxin system RelE/ParE family toxin [Clostridiales bacterium]